MTTPVAYKLDHALSLAEQGFRVFPIRPDSKVPKHGLPWKQAATTDVDCIRAWWKENPNYNTGVATGKGLIVVDVDVKNGKSGAASLEMLRAVDFPESYRVKTPSGGEHFYFKTDQLHRSRVDLADFPGIDIRCEGGYVVGPGSMIDGKPYEAVEAEIATLPAWFGKHLTNSAPRRSEQKSEPLVELDLPENIDNAKNWLTNFAPEAIEGSGGDATTYEVACQCRDFGLCEATTLEVMLDCWNEQKAAPPWMPEELSLKVANAYSYGQNAPGSKTAAAEFDAVDIDEDIAVTPEVRERLERVREAARVGFENRHLASKSANGKRKKRYLNYAEMISVPTPEWLVDGVLQERSSALMFGKSNTFKSFHAVSLACCVSTARRWHGASTKKGKALYVATEGEIAVGKLRIKGWMDRFDIPHADRANIFRYAQEVALDKAESVSQLIADMNEIGDVKLCVLDIFAGTMDGSEIEDTTARNWVRGVNRILRETGVTVLAVAHTGWRDETRARMHTHFWGSFDTRLRVTGDKDKLTSVMGVERHKDADSSGKWSFKLEPCNGTLIPVLSDAAALAGTALRPQHEKAMKALHAALTEHGKYLKDDDAPNASVISRKAWQYECSRLGISNTANIKSREASIRRACSDLINMGVVKSLKEYVYFTDEE